MCGAPFVLIVNKRSSSKESCVEGELIGGLVLPTPAEEIAITLKEDLEPLSTQRYFTVSIEKGLGESFETKSIP